MLKKSIFVAWLTGLAATVIVAQQREFQDLAGPYLGQKPPGKTPEIFAPGIVSRPGYFEHSAAVFSPDQNEVFWSAKPNAERYYKIYFMRLMAGKWTDPAAATFSVGDFNYNRPVFSPGGKKLFYDTDNGIWVVEKKSDGWSKPAKLPPIINSELVAKVHSVTSDESIYFSQYSPDSKARGTLMEDVYVSRKINGRYHEPEKLEESINSKELELSIYVAPDESYMLIEETKDSRSSEIFISHRMRDGSWTKRKSLNLGQARFPHVTPDGKYLFFLKRDGIYWADISIIDDKNSLR